MSKSTPCKRFVKAKFRSHIKLIAAAVALAVLATSVPACAAVGGAGALAPETRMEAAYKKLAGKSRVGERVKALRRLDDLPTKEVAQVAGIEEARLTAIEEKDKQKRGFPTAQEIAQLAKSLEVSPKFLTMPWWDSFASRMRRVLTDRMPQTTDSVPQGIRRSVMALVIRKGQDGYELLLTKRSRYKMKRLPGFWTPPGGSREPDPLSKDRLESISNAALRETQEETHVSLLKENIFGRLDDCFTRDGAYLITPVIVLVPQGTEWHKTEEAEDGHWLPLSELNKQDIFQQLEMREKKIEIDGRTQIILMQLNEIVREANRAKKSQPTEGCTRWRVKDRSSWEKVFEREYVVTPHNLAEILSDPLRILFLPPNFHHPITRDEFNQKLNSMIRDALVRSERVVVRITLNEERVLAEVGTDRFEFPLAMPETAPRDKSRNISSAYLVLIGIAGLTALAGGMHDWHWMTNLMLAPIVLTGRNRFNVIVNGGTHVNLLEAIAKGIFQISWIARFVPPPIRIIELPKDRNYYTPEEARQFTKKLGGRQLSAEMIRRLANDGHIKTDGNGGLLAEDIERYLNSRSLITSARLISSEREELKKIGLQNGAQRIGRKWFFFPEWLEKVRQGKHRLVPVRLFAKELRRQGINIDLNTLVRRIRYPARTFSRETIRNIFEDKEKPQLEKSLRGSIYHGSARALMVDIITAWQIAQLLMDTNKKLKEWYTIESLADEIGVNATVIRRAVCRGKIKAERVMAFNGRRWHYRISPEEAKGVIVRFEKAFKQYKPQVAEYADEPINSWRDLKKAIATWPKTDALLRRWGYADGKAILKLIQRHYLKGVFIKMPYVTGGYWYFPPQEVERFEGMDKERLEEIASFVSLYTKRPVSSREEVEKAVKNWPTVKKLVRNSGRREVRIRIHIGCGKLQAVKLNLMGRLSRGHVIPPIEAKRWLRIYSKPPVRSVLLAPGSRFARRNERVVSAKAARNALNLVIEGKLSLTDAVGAVREFLEASSNRKLADVFLGSALNPYKVDETPIVYFRRLVVENDDTDAFVDLVRLVEGTAAYFARTEPGGEVHRLMSTLLTQLRAFAVLDITIGEAKRISRPVELCPSNGGTDAIKDNYRSMRIVVLGWIIRHANRPFDKVKEEFGCLYPGINTRWEFWHWIVDKVTKDELRLFIDKDENIIVVTGRPRQKGQSSAVFISAITVGALAALSLNGIVDFARLAGLMMMAVAVNPIGDIRPFESAVEIYYDITGKTPPILKEKELVESDHKGIKTLAGQIKSEALIMRGQKIWRLYASLNSKNRFVRVSAYIILFALGSKKRKALGMDLDQYKNLKQEAAETASAYNFFGIYNSNGENHSAETRAFIENIMDAFKALGPDARCEDVAQWLTNERERRNNDEGNKEKKISCEGRITKGLIDRLVFDHNLRPRINALPKPKGANKEDQRKTKTNKAAAKLLIKASKRGEAQLSELDMEILKLIESAESLLRPVELRSKLNGNVPNSKLLYRLKYLNGLLADRGRGYIELKRAVGRYGTVPVKLKLGRPKWQRMRALSGWSPQRGEPRRSP